MSVFSSAQTGSVCRTLLRVKILPRLPQAAGGGNANPGSQMTAGILGYISSSLQVSDRTGALPLRGEI